MQTPRGTLWALLILALLCLALGALSGCATQESGCFFECDDCQGVRLECREEGPIFIDFPGAR